MLGTSEVEATFNGVEIMVSVKENANMLVQSGYGSMREDGSVILTECEALYLLAEKRISIINEPDKINFSVQSLLKRLRVKDPNIWTRYLIFRDLRSRGYVVKEGVGWGIDFRVYERGKYQNNVAKYIVFAICEGDPMPARKLTKTLQLVYGIKKKLIVAVVDRRGEIVYYSLSQLNLNSGS